MDKQYLNDIYSENLKDLNFKSYKKKDIKNILNIKGSCKLDFKYK